MLAYLHTKHLQFYLSCVFGHTVFGFQHVFVSRYTLLLANG